jgi:hypothetical protein
MRIPAVMPVLARAGALVWSGPRKLVTLGTFLMLAWYCLPDAERLPSRESPHELPPSAEPQNLERRLAAAQHRTVAKRRLAQQVAAGRLTLREAPERYHDLNATNPEFDRVAFGCQFPGPTEEERCCQEVMALVEAELYREPERARGMRRQLEATLEAYRKSGSLSWEL